MAFLVVVISLLIIYFSGALPSIQKDAWFVKWVTRLRQNFGLGKRRPCISAAILLLVPVFAVVVVLWLAEGILFGIPVLVLNVLFLLYSFGREDIASKIYIYSEALSRGDSQAAYHEASVFNLSYHESQAENQDELHRETLTAISYRYFEHYFAVIFWFLVLGAPAAVLYRLVALYSDLGLDNGNEKAVVNRWLWLFEWLPVRLMGLSLCVVGDFSGCFRSWQRSLTNMTGSTVEVLGSYLSGAMDISGGRSQEGPVVEGLVVDKQVAEVASVKMLHTRSLILMIILLALLVIFA